MIAIVAMFKWFSNWQSLFVVVLSAGGKMRHLGLEVRGGESEGMVAAHFRRSLGFVPRVSGHRWMMLGGEYDHPTTFRSGVTVAAEIRAKVCGIKCHVWYRREHLVVV